MESKEITKVESEVIDIQGASAKLTAMMAFVRQNLKKGTDFMSIQGGKPSLMKPGAEKMNILMGYYPEYFKVKEIMNEEKSFYYVEVKCTLKSRKDNQKVAECMASCNNKEKARENVAFYSALNPVLKMAEKRAYVGATLNANALSQFYTQDLEDEIATCPQTEPKQDEKGAVLNCIECGCEVSHKVAEYSSKAKGKVLCFSCQKSTKPIGGL